MSRMYPAFWRAPSLTMSACVGLNITGRLFWLASNWICCWICAPGVCWMASGRAAFSDAQEVDAWRWSSAGTWVFSVVNRALNLSGSVPVYLMVAEDAWLAAGAVVGAGAAGAGAQAPTISETAVRPIMR